MQSYPSLGLIFNLIIGLGFSACFSGCVSAPPPPFPTPFEAPAPFGGLCDGPPPLGANEGSGFLAGFACIEGSVGDALSLGGPPALTLPGAGRIFPRISRSRGCRSVTTRDLGGNGLSNLGRFVTAVGELSVRSRGRFPGLPEAPAESVSVFFRSRAGLGVAVGVPWATMESECGTDTEMLGRSDVGGGAGAGVEGGPETDGRPSLMDEPRERTTGLLGSAGVGVGTAEGAAASACAGLVR